MLTPCKTWSLIISTGASSNSARQKSTTYIALVMVIPYLTMKNYHVIHLNVGRRDLLTIARGVARNKCRVSWKFGSGYSLILGVFFCESKPPKYAPDYCLIAFIQSTLDLNFNRKPNGIHYFNTCSFVAEYFVKAALS